MHSKGQHVSQQLAREVQDQHRFLPLKNKQEHKGLGKGVHESKSQPPVLIRKSAAGPDPF